MLSEFGFDEIEQHVFKYDLHWTIKSFVGFMNSSSRMAPFGKSQRAELSNLFSGVVREFAGSDRFIEKSVAHMITGKYNSQ